LTVTGSTTAASAIARGANFTPTLVAAANNDVLVGLDIAPTFTNGSFNGVSNFALRVQGPTQINSSLTIGNLLSVLYNLQNQEVALFQRAGSYGPVIRLGRTGITNATTIDYPTDGAFGISTSGTEKFRIFNNGNVVIQNGGTFIDAGFRLDVNGTARIQGNTIITGSLTVVTGNAVELQVTPTGVNIGSVITDTHNITGSVTITGSLALNNSNVILSNQTSSMSVATASFATNAANATTASYVLNAVSASHATFAVTAGSSTTSQTSSFSNNFTVANTLILDQTLTDYATVASSIAGSNNLFTQATGSYTSVFIKYTATNGSNTRAGEVIAAWNGANTTFTDFSTVDLGTTNAVTASVSIVTAQVQFNIQTNTSGWRLKAMATFI
jgi:hypothetical protein